MSASTRGPPRGHSRGHSARGPPRTISDSTIYTRKRVAHVHTYKWPWIPFNIWMFLMLVSSSAVIGVFSLFIQIQYRLLLPVPWYFPYYITVAAFSVLYVCLLVFLLSRHRLLPAIVMIGAFLVFVLWFVGLIVVAIQLWGTGASVNGVCNLEVFSRSPRGDSEETLAWLMEKSICQSWHAVFAFSLVGILCLMWIMVMAYDVFVASL